MIYLFFIEVKFIWKIKNVCKVWKLKNETQIDFSGYFPPEAQETPIIDEKQNAFEEYDEDRAC